MDAIQLLNSARYLRGDTCAHEKCVRCNFLETIFALGDLKLEGMYSRVGN
jgi:hypothetical protein